VKGRLGEYLDFAEPSALPERLKALGEAKARVRLDPDSTPVRFAQILQTAGAKFVSGQDPCLHAKAVKNEVEIKGVRAAHLRDGVAIARFLAWLDEVAESGKIDEIAAAIKLEDSRRESGQLRDISFDTISAFGANGAIVHYRPTTKGKRLLESGSLYLIDSGAQYRDGTTDVTRTIAIGRPTPEMRDRFTRVLKGHIALARVRFPKGVSGHQLDALARVALWEAGLDYEHGTGHGVGSYLGVHEGPQRIAKFVNAQPLEPGMIVSNEPGYYKTGAYGIRIENLQIVTPPFNVEGGERPMFGFETLTLAPIDRRLIIKQMLSKEERAWLDSYHARVCDVIGAQLKGEEAAWAEEATAPL
jgi:Xaa-Pro aminopeptidase